MAMRRSISTALFSASRGLNLNEAAANKVRYLGDLSLSSNEKQSDYMAMRRSISTALFSASRGLNLNEAAANKVRYLGDLSLSSNENEKVGLSDNDINKELLSSNNKNNEGLSENYNNCNSPLLNSILSELKMLHVEMDKYRCSQKLDVQLKREQEWNAIVTELRMQTEDMERFQHSQKMHNDQVTSELKAQRSLLHDAVNYRRAETEVNAELKRMLEESHHLNMRNYWMLVDAVERKYKPFKKMDFREKVNYIYESQGNKVATMLATGVGYSGYANWVRKINMVEKLKILQEQLDDNALMEKLKNLIKELNQE